MSGISYPAGTISAGSVPIGREGRTYELSSYLDLVIKYCNDSIR